MRPVDLVVAIVDALYEILTYLFPSGRVGIVIGVLHQRNVHGVIVASDKQRVGGNFPLFGRGDKRDFRNLNDSKVHLVVAGDDVDGLRFGGDDRAWDRNGAITEVGSRFNSEGAPGVQTRIAGGLYRPASDDGECATLQLTGINQAAFQQVVRPRCINAGVGVGGPAGPDTSTDGEGINGVDEGRSAGAAQIAGNIDVLCQQRDDISGFDQSGRGISAGVIHVKQSCGAQSDIATSLTGPYAATGKDIDCRCGDRDQVCRVDSILNRYCSGGRDGDVRRDGMELPADRAKAANRTSQQDLVVRCEADGATFAGTNFATAESYWGGPGDRCVGWHVQHSSSFVDVLP